MNSRPTVKQALFLLLAFDWMHLADVRARGLFALVLASTVLASACTGFDNTHFSCWDGGYMQANPTLGTAPHKFDAGPGKDHRCTKAELDAAGVSNDERPADQR